MITILENARIVISLLKAHNIHYVVASPGGSNIPIVEAVQQDPFFKVYSVVDERSAMYFAIGLYLQTGEIIATSCTSAQATRNYVPGLTEAYYKHVPILAITMSKHPVYVKQDYMQCPIQTSLPVDAVKKSYSLPYIHDDNDRTICVRTVNEAILELTHHGIGPVQLNIEELDSETWSFTDSVEIPKVRVINRYGEQDEWPISLDGKKVMLLMGEHRPYSKEETEAIDKFSEAYNVFVHADNIANYHGKYALQPYMISSKCSQKAFMEILKPDVVISIGGILGEYGIFSKLFNAPISSIEHWRVAVDGNVVDTFKKLTKIFECSPLYFLRRASEGKKSDDHSYYELWKSYYDNIVSNMELPLSNLYIAQQLHNDIPVGSTLNFAILNSFRSWLCFPTKAGINCSCPVAAYGIDGGMSIFFGESVETDKLSFFITGDLAYLYDMNSMAIRHIKNNVRIILVNNNGGMEFKFGDLVKKFNVGEYVAADNHFKNAKGWAETCGFDYYAINTKDDFLKNKHKLIEPSSKPVIFEVFSTPDQEREASRLLNAPNRILSKDERLKQEVKNGVKGLLGDKGVATVKKLMGKEKNFSYETTHLSHKFWER